MNSQSLSYAERLFADYQADTASVPTEWRQFFQEMENGQDFALTPAHRNGNGSGQGVAPPPAALAAPPTEPTRQPPAPHVALSGAHTDYDERGEDQLKWVALQERVDQLVRNHRVRGHITARIDPLKQDRPYAPELDPAYYGFSEADLDRVFSVRNTEGPVQRPLREIISMLRTTYCRYIGVQFMHIDDLAVREWLQFRMEKSQNRIQLRRDQQLRIHRKLTDAVIFEEFVQKKFLGAKSFSLEGAESLIPLLDMAIERAGDEGAEEVVLGMAHRGRLNVMANICGKDPRQIFREFADVDPELHVGRGDVKYHLGCSNEFVTGSGHKLHLSLCFNPSHLEFVNTVAMGRLRAKQDHAGDHDRRRGLLLLVHGDAAFAGEGIVQETLNLSELPGYRVGGAIHVVVNNQIGFTTTPSEGRSSVYCTDVAKMLQIPIFHVNGEHPESVAQVLQLAMDFRREFQRDVVIDMLCYRLRGHNEGDEPSFTQPMQYREINAHRPVRESYLKHLLKLGGISPEEAEGIVAERYQHLERELASSRAKNFVPRRDMLSGDWQRYTGGPESEAPDVDTHVPHDMLVRLLEAQATFPEDFKLHPKIARATERREEMAHGKAPLDWAAGEALALASLAADGVRIRITGQDAQRGTFSHRHAVLHDYENGSVYMPLAELSDDQGPVEIHNSPLSEAGVLGFEYGYSLDCPDGLVVWEAQFGDFANAAQVVIDQFIASAEDKWRRLSGLVLLLPHGFEGQGPEHSSARLERFLLLAAEDNIQVVYPSTPAQLFHVLRRQVVRPWRKPLIVMTPKSLLRHKQCVSSMEDLSAGKFQRVIPDGEIENPAAVRRILLCTGKIYYELREKREQLDRKDIAILRVEQLYPLPTAELIECLKPYHDGTHAVWVQEEPENMGAWRYLRIRMGDQLFGRFPFSDVCRPASASPATGSKTSHQMEQDHLIAEALGV
ncbi:2-oxoglutarate dehydrogenase E1 component [Pirellulimonas nuda]|uniref:2-oxoglutarate dehydrogenase E1 component n=1 Tax=Pirellulimonas nuda TaxID=2528009 RepID=A0A518D7U6_9BACT|nr:2-oxoglutarate dehydrogenase E1 component [Pirellulimonas nuda]QDU87525.1 2-oxoglutarate dehydrogenase E1 component [Pirellulimonas nuda]